MIMISLTLFWDETDNLDYRFNFFCEKKLYRLKEETELRILVSKVMRTPEGAKSYYNFNAVSHGLSGGVKLPILAMSRYGAVILLKILIKI